MSEPTLFKIGSVAAIVGGILAVVVNILHPTPPERGNTEALLRLVAESSIWVPDHVGIVFVVLLTLGAAVAIARSITGERGASLARLGVAGALTSAAIAIVLFAIDGIALKDLAMAWLNAPAAEKEVAFRVAEAVEAIGEALFSLWIIVFFGITFLLYGLAVALGDGYPKWLGWVAVVAALGSLLVGVAQSFSGLSVLMTDILFPLFSLILTLWLVIIGFLLWRKARTTTGSGASILA